MEVLAVTLTHTMQDRDADVLMHIRQTLNMLHNAPGLLTSSLYRCEDKASAYLLLTTWEDNEAWQKAQEQYNLKNLLMSSLDLIPTQPEQWLMHYLWGYNRPISPPMLVTLQLITAASGQIEQLQRGWQQLVQQQMLQSTLAFGFLARGSTDETTIPLAKTGLHLPHKPLEAPYIHGTVLLNFFSWGSNAEQEEFYHNSLYREIIAHTTQIGKIRAFPLSKT